MKNRKLLWHSRFAPWLFLLPTIIGLLVFRLIPIVWAFVLSFTQWSLLGSPNFVGLSNFIEAFNTEAFLQTFSNTIEFSLIYVVGSIIFGLFLAVLINIKIKSIAFFRAVIYLPVVTSAVAVGIVWNWILGPNIGLVHSILANLNITAPYWLGDPKLALTTVASVQVWKMAGYSMILFLSGLQGISAETLEAAIVDGASKVQRFFRITLPMLSPTVFFVLTVSIIDSFKNFELIYAMTKGGPQNSTNTLVYDVYLNAFVYYRVGYASAVAFVLLVFVGVLTLLNFYIKRHWAQPLE
ncbi:MAG: sugar ABC transporter permease [Sphaerochaetaceae bacterium]|nr:sugar ABC transporter permease [Sphaerochaetaceae bacterium]MDC7237892.1 sugar ABC transporter permease [Sphaerochaetaceae bacterium]MDC7250098.1 sugar ABC transporter permease [Sphaerochaetaceae bacterium]